MKALLDKFETVIEILNKNNLQDKIILIGSWAYYIYQNYFFDKKLLPESLRTFDIDLFISRKSKFETEINLIQKLEEQGFIWFRDVRVEIDKFEYQDFKIDILTEAKGKDAESKGIEIKSLGIKCGSVRYWNLLTSDLITREIKKNIIVTLPKPENYLLHKLIIAQCRPDKDRGRTKKEKDIIQAMTLIENISFENIKNLYSKLFPNWRKKIKDSLKDLDYYSYLNELKKIDKEIF